MSQEGESRFQQGTAMLEAGRYADCIKYLNEAIMMLPKGSSASVAAHLNLAKALIDSPDGDPGANCEKSIRCLKDLLAICVKKDNPEPYGKTNNLLGCAYRGLLEVDDNENYLIWAIEHFREALSVFTAEADPDMFCTVSYNLAVLYGYADIRGVDIGGIPLFEARSLLENLLPVAKKLRHPKFAIYSKLYQDTRNRF